MWNGRRSIALSRFCVLIFMALFVCVAAAAPWIVRWFLGFSRAFLKGAEPCFLATIYSGFAAAMILLFCLFRLLRRIEAEQVFVSENVEDLRRISWSCFAGAMICLASSFYYFPWIFVSVSAAFMGLIVRVVKNVFAQAVELKNESDYTI